MTVKYKLRGYTFINKRKDRRLETDVLARVDGGGVIVKDISFGGMAIVASDADFQMDDIVLIDIRSESGETHALNATVIRIGANGEFGLQFNGLSSDAFRKLEDIQTGQSRRRRHKHKASSAGR